MGTLYIIGGKSHGLRVVWVILLKVVCKKEFPIYLHFLLNKLQKYNMLFCFFRAMDKEHQIDGEKK